MCWPTRPPGRFGRRESARRYAEVLEEGRVFLGEESFDHLHSTVFVKESLLTKSYCTTATLEWEGKSFERLTGPLPPSEFAQGHMARLGVEKGDNAKVVGRVRFPVTRILHDIHP